MIHRRQYGLLVLAVLACTNGNSTPQRPPDRPEVRDPNDMTKPTTPSADAVSKLAQKLVELGYPALFQRMDHAEADALWRSSPAELDALVRSTTHSHEARFLASEILFLENPGYPPADLRPVLAPLYAEALTHAGRKTGRWHLMGNPWGLTYVNGDIGTLGAHLLALGPDAIAALRPLLGNDEPVAYEGSEDATVGNEQMYRVKDLAAYYLGRLTGKTVAFHADFKARDRELDQLARSLP